MTDYFRKFRIFQKLRSTALERISYYLTLKNFRMGQDVFREGTSPVDGVYFIKSGEFEVTLKRPKSAANLIPQRILRLFILSSNEVLGLDEIVQQETVRKSTCTCVSLHGQAHFMPLEAFCDFVNSNKFAGQLLQEHVLSSAHTQERIRQTLDY